MAEYLFLSRTLFYLDIMSHLADHEAWWALDCFDPEFARDSRSVRHGLSTNSFRHHNTDNSPYSCWPIFIMPYNLPPNKYLKQGFIFLTLVIPVLRNRRSKKNILRLLIEELMEL
jgi:hypothetical protein